MPPRKYKRKRKFKKKKGYRSNPRMLSLGPYMPDRCLGKHKYTQVVALSQTYAATDITTSARNSFSCNGMYDVDETGTGHQPRFFDEMSSFYDKYRVIGSKITVKFINLSAEPCYVILHKGTQTLGANWDAQELRELKNVQTRVLHSLDTGPRSVVRLSSGFSPANFMDRPKILTYADEELEAPYTQNPAKQFHWTIGCTQVSSALGASANLTVQAEVTVNYTVEWFDRKMVTQPS